MKIVNENYQGSVSELHEIGIIYDDLGYELLKFSNYVIQRLLMKEGLFQKMYKLEEEISDDNLAETANNISNLVNQLTTTQKKFIFDQPSFAERYRDELEICESAINYLNTELNSIWKFGSPGKHEEVIMPIKILNKIKYFTRLKRKKREETTNYDVIFSILLTNIKIINDETKHINNKVKVFNRLNKKIEKLHGLSLLTSPPRWTSKYEQTKKDKYLSL